MKLNILLIVSRLYLGEPGFEPRAHGLLNIKLQYLQNTTTLCCLAFPTYATCHAATSPPPPLPPQLLLVTRQLDHPKSWAWNHHFPPAFLDSSTYFLNNLHIVYSHWYYGTITVLSITINFYSLQQEHLCIPLWMTVCR